MAGERRGERVAAYALRQAMEPDWRPAATAQSIVALAAGDHAALRWALGRILSRSVVRSTPVGDRAVVALRLALQGAAGPADR